MSAVSRSGGLELCLNGEGTVGDGLNRRGAGPVGITEMGDSAADGGRISCWKITGVGVNWGGALAEAWARGSFCLGGDRS